MHWNTSEKKSGIVVGIGLLSFLCLYCCVCLVLFISSKMIVSMHILAVGK